MINSKKIYFVNLVLALLPNTSMNSLKIRLLKWAGVNIGKNVEIFQGLKIHGNGEICIEDNVFIGHDVLILINKGSSLYVSKSSVISSRVIIATGFHKITPLEERVISREGTTSNIFIGKGAAILMDSKILPGVNIGEKSIVAAGSLVNKDVNPYTLVAGIPIKEKKRLI